MFHPVIQSILNRRNLETPANDGRKISLVLYGGVMAGVAGGAAVIALEELGLTNAFDDIYVVSAGLPNASYFLSGQTKIGTSIYYEDLDRNKFINFFKFWKPADTDKVVKVIRDIKKLNVGKVLSSKTKIWVRLFNVTKKKPEYLNVSEVCKNNDDYFSLLKSSITFSTIWGAKKIRGNYYVDGAMWGGKNIDGDRFGKRDYSYIKDHFDYVNKQEHTDILVIYPGNKPNYLNNSNKVYEIILPVEISNFETKSWFLKLEALKAGLFVKQAFGVDKGITLH